MLAAQLEQGLVPLERPLVLRPRSIRLARNVSSENGSGTSVQVKSLNSSRRPFRTASISAGSVCEMKYWNGSRAPHSSPWK